jgi:methylenetetrahydrofolate--tRNA-(uracil-5-)-methyltransferase
VDGTPVTVIGGGLAGSEAAWQLAERGIPVRLMEMRPGTSSPAHHGGDLAELVCSNSLKSVDPETAPGMLKRELEALGSLVMRTARACAVPAGGALAVDRTLFSRAMTDALAAHPLVDLVREEATALPDGDVVIATGPLTSHAFESALTSLLGETRLAFHDAAAPIVDASTVDLEVAFSASRYDKGGGADYLNCPLDREAYAALIDALVTAERVHAKEFETSDLFQACQPVEEVARRGLDTLRFGALKPVGLTDPRTGERPWAVVQLRPENRDGTAYNLVGFQTNLTFGEQRRVFRTIPGIEGAEFLRYGVMHRNTFVDAPRLLTPTLALRAESRVRIAGQLAGTEGYLEAAAGGLVAALDVAASQFAVFLPPVPRTTALGALLAYAADPKVTDYQPMHVNFGLLPTMEPPVRNKRRRHAALSDRAGGDLLRWIAQLPQQLRPPTHAITTAPLAVSACEDGRTTPAAAR